MGASSHKEPPVTQRPNPYKGESVLNGKIVVSNPDKINYPKHVWSPAGGWYSRPANWKANTAIVGGVIVGLAGILLAISADREERYGKTPLPGRFYPSRYWSREIREAEKKRAESEA